MAINIRNLHRDLGYLYVGLIISFALSGMFFNHRDSWHPEKYTVKITEIAIKMPAVDSITEDIAKNMMVKDLKINDKFKKHLVRKGKLKITAQNHDVEIDMKTGKGEIIEFIKTPFISQIMMMHKSTSNWWIYYSDVFALSLITIAITGTLIIPKGRLSFKERGWKLALIGILFPLVFIFFLA